MSDEHASVLERLEAVEAYVAIQQLAFRYAQAVDARDFALYAP